jgi:hypothetical protein
VPDIVTRLSQALPATKVARYLQIENKIRSVLRYDLASVVPLVPAENGGRFVALCAELLQLAHDLVVVRDRASPQRLEVLVVAG